MQRHPPVFCPGRSPASPHRRAKGSWCKAKGGVTTGQRIPEWFCQELEVERAAPLRSMAGAMAPCPGKRDACSPKAEETRKEFFCLLTSCASRSRSLGCPVPQFLLREMGILALPSLPRGPVRINALRTGRCSDPTVMRAVRVDGKLSPRLHG